MHCNYMIVHVQHYLLLCVFLQNDDQLKSKLKIKTFTRDYGVYSWNIRASYVTDTLVWLAHDNIHW